MQQQYAITIFGLPYVRNASLDYEGLITLCEYLDAAPALPTTPGKFQLNCVLNWLGHGLFQNKGTVAEPDFQGIGGGIETVRVHLTQAEILQLNTVPKVLVPAQGANTVIDVISVAGFMDYGTVQYASHTNIEVLEGGNALWSNSNLLPAVIDVAKTFNQNGGATFATNTPVIAQVSGGDPVNGDGSLDIFVTYKVYSTTI